MAGQIDIQVGPVGDLKVLEPDEPLAVGEPDQEDLALPAVEGVGIDELPGGQHDGLR
jgi:hypothetical protein